MPVARPAFPPNQRPQQSGGDRSAIDASIADSKGGANTRTPKWSRRAANVWCRCSSTRTRPRRWSGQSRTCVIQSSINCRASMASFVESWRMPRGTISHNWRVRSSSVCSRKESLKGKWNACAACPVRAGRKRCTQGRTMHKGSRTCGRDNTRDWWTSVVRAGAGRALADGRRRTNPQGAGSMNARVSRTV